MPYVGVEPVPQATWRRPYGTTKTASDTLTVPYGYTVGYIKVEIEGRVLNPDEYTADDGATVVFDQELPVGTNWAFEILSPFQTSDHWAKGEADDRFFARRRNLLINGGFQVAQRFSSSAPSANNFIIDRWQIRGTNLSGGTVAISKFDNDISTNWLPTRRYIKLETTGVESTYLFQKIENPASFSGQTVTISGDAAFDYSVKFEVTITALIGGVSHVEVKSDTIDYKNGGFKFTLDVPSFTEQPGDDDYIQIVINIGNTDNPLPDGNYRFGNIQAEFGDVATPFEYRHPAEELALCQRYFYAIYALKCPMSTSSSGGRSVGAIWLPVKMRASPTTTTSGFKSYNYWNSGSETTSTYGDLLDTSPDLRQILFQSNTTTGEGKEINYASADEVTADAEL